jgi:hypothetical protein
LLVLHGREIAAKGRFHRFPDQARTLAAIDRLEAVCLRAGVTRDQALAALDPVRVSWLDHETLHPLMLLGPTGSSPRVPDELVRPTLLSSLSLPDREALFGGLDASPYLEPLRPSAEPVADSRLVRTFRVARSSIPGRYVASGWPSYLEFELTPAASPAAAEALSLSLPVSGAPSLEIWWTDSSGRWTESRSVRLRPDPSGPSSIPLARLPHWDSSRVRRIRVAIRERGPIEVGEPKLVR